MTQNASIPETIEVDDADQCRHHWVIQPATGPVSQGICQSCGDVRDFKNYVEGAAWGDSRLNTRSSGEGTADVSRVVADQVDSEEDEN